MTKKTCLQCGLLKANGNICPVFKGPRTEENKICDYFSKHLQTCEICGLIILPTTLIYDMTDETPHIICEGCQSRTGTCATCSKSQECKFQTDPSNLPFTIQKQIRQGNMVMVTEIKNPERIRQTCAKGCPCFDPETQECNKELGICGSWSISYQRS